MTIDQTKALLMAMATEARDLNAQSIRVNDQPILTAMIIEAVLTAGITRLNKMIAADASEP